MKSVCLLAVLVLVAACSRPSKQADTKSAWSPKFGRTAALYAVVDDTNDERIGYVERTVYDDGKVLYWVKDLDREENLGFILPTGRAYKYEWYAGKRSAEPADLGADVRAVGARKILGHGNACRLEEISFKKLEAEMTAKPKDPAPKTDDADEDGESEDE